MEHVATPTNAAPISHTQALGADQSLTTLIAAALAAHDAHEAACAALGLVESKVIAGEFAKDGPEITAAEGAENEASDAASAAYNAAMQMPAASPDEARAKVALYQLFNGCSVQYGAGEPITNDDGQIESERETNALLRDLMRFLPETEPAKVADDAGAEWRAARDAYLAAKAASDAYTPEMDVADPEGSNAALDAVADAMERWESITPPSLDAMVEVMGASLDFNGFLMRWQNVSDPRALRDLLDGGDTHEIFAARYYLHARKLARRFDGWALACAPIAGLFPAYREAEGAEIRDFNHWERFHSYVRPYDTRRGELVNWWKNVERDPDTRGTLLQCGVENIYARQDALAELNQLSEPALLHAAE